MADVGAAGERLETVVTALARAFNVVHVLSLDAPLVAVGWQLFLARCLNVKLAWPTVVALGLAVWIIYAADRWLDGLRMPASAPRSDRHRFAIRHRAGVLAGLSVGTVAAIALVATVLDPLDVVWGGGVALLSGVYMLLRHAPRTRQCLPAREVVVGALFSLGTCLPVVIRCSHTNQGVVAAVLFAALCALNCQAISIWESRMDQAQGDTVPMLRAGHVTVAAAILVLVSLSVRVWGGMGLETVGEAVSLGALMIGALNGGASAVSLEARRIVVEWSLVAPLAVVLFAHGQWI